ncbi:hypothetical protein [Actinoplanes sp. M2I2]|uniref:hypothetical protein n=1 Tax=Actinoplanes sp. M2I2 TaxID=1734444 RepID=UPI002020E0DB|nr:hypothetical protein [Actinoplanes sp. M2I2]
MSLTKKSISVAVATLLTTSLSLVVAASPAAATTTACRSPKYVTSSWNVDICVTNSGLDSTGTYETVAGYATVTKRPSSCKTFRIVLVDSNNEAQFATGPRWCSETNPPRVVVWDGAFGEGTVKARFVAYSNDAATDAMLTRDSPYINALD